MKMGLRAPFFMSPMVRQKVYTTQFYLLCLSSFLFFSSFNMIVPDLYDYLTSLGGGAYKGYVIALFTVTAGLSRPFSGKLSDTIGRIPVMIFGAGVCFFMGFLYPLLGNVWAFLLLRLFHGFSTGFKPTGTAAYIADIVPADRRGEAMGYSGFFGSLGMAAGPSLGPRITDTFGIDMMFYTSSFVALLSVLILIGMKETLPDKVKFSPSLLVVRKNEIFEPRVFNPSVMFLLTSFSFGAALTLMPDLSYQVGFAKADKGIFFTIFVFASLAARILAGKTSDKYGRVIVLKYAAIAIVIADLMVAFTYTQNMFIASSVVFGIAVGMNTPTIYAWTVDLSLDHARGKGLATMYIALETGIGLGAFVAGEIYGNLAENLRIAFIVAAGMAALAFLFLNFGLNWMRGLVREPT